MNSVCFVSEKQPDITKLAQLPGLRDNTTLTLIRCDENSDKLGIDFARMVKKSLTTIPPNHTTQIVLIQKAQLLTVEAQNAILKIIEEPPERTILVLVTPNESLLIPTILSRCVTFYDQPPVAFETVDKTADFPSANDLFRQPYASQLITIEPITQSNDKSLQWIDATLANLHALLQSNPDDLKLALCSQSLIDAKRAIDENTNQKLALDYAILSIAKKSTHLAKGKSVV